MDNQLSFLFDEETEELSFSDEMKEIKPVEEEPEVVPEVEIEEEQEVAPVEEVMALTEISVGGQVRTKYARDTYVVRKIIDNIAIVENPSTKDTHEMCLKDLLGL
ncbi:MAG: hypothetical protein II169_08355 [Lachnospiraceae bacterium]|nr:hypothetical protein [Lachnospiraceae bacterium]